MKKMIVYPCLLALCGGAPVAAAQVPAAEWERFKADFAAMAARVSALEAENARLRARAAPVPEEDLGAPPPAPRHRDEPASWTETVRWKGDFRYRFEEIEEEGRDDRDRNRIRARAALLANPRSDVEVGLGMASGGDDPVSTNQTLGGGGSTKDLRLDLAYFSWTGLDDTYITAGKFANPFYRVQGSELIWDGDFRPEGVALGWQGETLFANASYNFLESDSSADDDAIFGLQVGATLPLFDALALTATAKYLDIPSEGRPAFDPDDPDFFGNSSEIVGGEAVYALDYEVVNLSLDLGFNLWELPLNLYADYVENQDADDLDSGYLVGLLLGEGKKAGQWQLRYQYQDLEADATLGLITNSDFAGGGTDGEGYTVSARYAIDSSWYLGATWIDAARGVDLGDDADYQRLMLDTGFKY